MRTDDVGSEEPMPRRPDSPPDGRQGISSTVQVTSGGARGDETGSGRSEAGVVKAVQAV